MKIISNFKDYYDNIFGYDSDDDVLYVRTTEIYKPTPHTQEETIYKKNVKLLEQLLRKLPRCSYAYNFSIVGFCGKVYASFVENHHYRDNFAKDLQRKHPTLDSIEEFYAKILNNKTLDKYNGHDAKVFFSEADEDLTEKYWPSWKNPKIRNTFNKNNILEVLDQFNGTKIGDELFVLIDSPSFVYYSGTLIKAPILNNNNLIKYVDPFTANQSVAGYMSSVLCIKDNGPQTVGGDLIVAQSKGFDEYSFRTMAPGKKKENRKINKERTRK